jgi:hypothetical protein
MKFGLSTVTCGVFSTRENYKAVAVAAERAGFDFLSVSDHVVAPAHLRSKYPYAASGVFAAAEHGYCLDQLATMAWSRRSISLRAFVPSDATRSRRLGCSGHCRLPMPRALQ